MEEELENPLTADLIKQNLERDILQFVGTEGLGEGIQIIKLDEKAKRFIVCCGKEYSLIRCAITLASNFEETLCAYTIHQSLTNLNSAIANSRQFDH